MKQGLQVNFIFIVAISVFITGCEKAPTPNVVTNTTTTNKNTFVTTTPIPNKKTVVANAPQNTANAVVNSQPTTMPIQQNKRLGMMPNNSSTPSAETLVTIEKFEKLTVGMNYKEAVSILGSKGATQGGLKTQTGAMQMYSWKGKSENGDWIITARFEKGKLVNKSQFGLK